MDPKEQALQDYIRHMNDTQAYQKLVEYEAKSMRQKQVAEVLGVQKQDDGAIIATVRIMQDALNNETMFRQSLQMAMQETIRAIASVLLNERKAEIEAACNFEDLRDVLAAELARQFMAARLTGASTPFDKPMNAAKAYQAGGVAASTSQPIKLTP